jgi:formylglycine-generating enzyme required for sulfatase activity
MQKTIKQLGIALLVATIVFSFIACQDSGGGTAPTITTASLPDGTVETPYDQTLRATGDKPITWSIESGTLPAGLSLASIGAITGTPEEAKTSHFTVKATNAAGSNTKQLTIIITGIGGGIAPEITTEDLPNGTLGEEYNQTLTATGDDPIIWSIESGELPEGLDLDEETGAITGMPEEAKTSHFTVQATNATGYDTKQLTIIITGIGGGFAPEITTEDLPGGTVGTAYSETLEATGDDPITWSIEGELPEGLELDEETGEIFGTPDEAGTSHFTVIATNAAGDNAKQLSIAIASIDGGTAPDITTESLPDGAMGKAYNHTLTATGDDPITWTIDIGTLPAGLGLNEETGAITGTPTTGGESHFTVKAHNGAGSGAKDFTIKIIAPPTITTDSLPIGILTVAYNHTLTATEAPVTWSLDGVALLPNGLRLDGATGEISGTPEVVGTSTFTVKATNAAGSVTKQLSITIYRSAPTIITASLPGGIEGTEYSQTLEATGVTPITWSLYYQTLPLGLTLAADGTISGTPTTTGTSNFTVQATNSAGSDTKYLTIIIIREAPTITTSVLPGGTVGTEYSQTLAVEGVAPIAWSIESGTLPAGLDLDDETGEISGTPTAAGTSTFTVKAINTAGNDTKQFSIIIKALVPEIPGMVWIEGGNFTMGSPTTGEPGRQTDETQRQITLTKGFYMGIYPVTQAEYQAVMGTTPSYHRVGGTYASKVAGMDTPNFPVEGISWYAAVAYCNALSVKENLTPVYNMYGSPVSGTIPTTNNSGWNSITINENANGYRLPTEAQWEYACRAETEGPFNTGNNITTSQANYDGSHPYNNNPVGVNLDRTTKVGSYEPNKWGLYDMHGNVTEWCWDRYGNYIASQTTDPTGMASGDSRVRRGGSFISYGENLRSAARSSGNTYSTSSYCGLRVVRPLVEEE